MSTSGYEITIKVFLPADPKMPETMAHAADVLRLLKDHDVSVGIKDYGDGYVSLPNVSVDEPRWIARRKSVPAPSTTPPADGSAQDDPAQAVQIAGSVQDTAAEVLSPDASAAGDHHRCCHPLNRDEPCGGAWTTVGIYPIAKRLWVCSSPGCSAMTIAQAGDSMSELPEGLRRPLVPWSGI